MHRLFLASCLDGCCAQFCTPASRGCDLSTRWMRDALRAQAGIPPKVHIWI
jgi:hypothetical protein